MKELPEGGIIEEKKFMFDETKQYGQFAEIVLSDSIVYYSAIFHIVGFKEWCDEAIDLAKKWLQREVDKYIPPAYEVKWIIKQPTDGDPLFRNGTVGWKYTPKAKS